MTDEDILQRIRKVIMNQKGFGKVREDDIGLNSSLRKDLRFDSLALVELSIACEDEFGIEIPAEDTEYDNIDTIREAITYFSRKLK